MRQTIVALALVFVTGLAAAQQSISSFRHDGRLIQVGDTTAAVGRVLGRPDQIVTLESRQGGAVGQRWEYWDVPAGMQSTSVIFIMQSGKVARIERQVHR